MAKYRKISPRIWNDAKVRELTDKGKLAFLFMLTHPTMTPFGAIRANVPGLAFELGWSASTFSKAMRELCDSGMARMDREATLIWFPNFLKYNKPESPNVIRSWAGAFEDLPECCLRNSIYKSLVSLAQSLGKSFVEAFREAFEEPLEEALPEDIGKAFGEASDQPSPNQEQEQEQDIKNKNTASATLQEATISQPAPPGGAEYSPSAPTAKKGRKTAAPPPEPHYQAKSGKYLTGKRLDAFNQFWRDFDFPKGKAEAADAWLAINPMTDALAARICDAARQEASQRGQLQARGQTPKWPQGWLYGRRWEDYEPSRPPQHASRSDVIPRDLTPEEMRKTAETRRRLEAERKQRFGQPSGEHEAQAKLNNLVGAVISGASQASAYGQKGAGA